MSQKTTIRPERRNFLKQLGAGSLAALSFPALAEVTSAPMPAANGVLADEKYWEQIKKQFSVPSNLIMLNAANLCPTPIGVYGEVEGIMNGLQKDVSFQYRSKFTDKRKMALAALSEYVGVAPEEIGITRNTSESNNIVVNGLELNAGDEVILWDQNHPSNGAAWEQRAKRYGFTIKKVTVPASPESLDDLVKPFRDAVTLKTKLIGFSHISNTSGLALPAKLLCEMASGKNILTLVDGAQSLGCLDLDLKDMGCNFFTGSTHKWFMGPIENGILYIKKGTRGKIWPSVISAGWKEGSVSVDEKYCALGQRNEATLFGLPETVKFHQTIGKKNVENRVGQLNSYLKSQIKTKLPSAVFVTPISPDYSSGVTIVSFPDKRPAELSQKLYEMHGIAAAPTGGIRMSPHIYNTMSDIDKVIKALASLSV